MKRWREFDLMFAFLLLALLVHLPGAIQGHWLGAAHYSSILLMILGAGGIASAAVGWIAGKRSAVDALPDLLSGIAVLVLARLVVLQPYERLETEWIEHAALALLVVPQLVKLRIRAGQRSNSSEGI